MAADFYDNLSKLDILRRAWHLARVDSRKDFVVDPYRCSDFAFRLDDNLKSIAQAISEVSYHPRPILTIDIPKSSLAVRPGSSLAIEDKIVLFSIAYLIAPILDKKIPKSVYSWRVKKDYQKNKEFLFKDDEFLKFPFLKSKTIRRRIDFVEPWYGVWPTFVKELQYLYERDGYKYMVVSDITAYFENIDLYLLRDLLMRYLPDQAKTIDFLINLLTFWAWQSVQGVSVPRGIPQGNSVSSFLGNIYLLPIDQTFQKFAKEKDIKYLRYMDDIKILTKDKAIAREALFLLNNNFRSLRLSIQSSKTEILEKEKIRKELVDKRLEKIGRIIESINGKNLAILEEKRYLKKIKEILRMVKKKRGLIIGLELRLFRRVMTALTLLRDSFLVKRVLKQFELNADLRIIQSSVSYLRVQDGRVTSIAMKLINFLKKKGHVFSYQRANYFYALSYMKVLPTSVVDVAIFDLSDKDQHWYVRQMAAFLISKCELKHDTLKILKEVYEKETKVEVKRAILQALVQLPHDDVERIFKELLFAVEPKLQRLGRFYYGLLADEQKSLEQVQTIFNNYTDDKLFDRVFEIEVVSKSAKMSTKAELLRILKRHSNKIHNSTLKKRIKNIREKLEAISAHGK